jgi:hypothetical protein
VSLYPQNLLKSELTNLAEVTIIERFKNSGYVFTIGFAGFFRFNGVRNIQADHIEWYEVHIRIFVPRSKTDVYREGKFVYIQRIGGEYCPVSVLFNYMNSASIGLESYFYSLGKGVLSYLRSREVFKEALTTLSFDAKKYDLHSLTSGGLSSVVQNSDNSIRERLVKLHGRWKTDAAKDMYVQESVHSMLKVSTYLGF